MALPEDHRLLNYLAVIGPCPESLRDEAHRLLGSNAGGGGSSVSGLKAITLERYPAEDYGDVALSPLLDHLPEFIFQDSIRIETTKPRGQSPAFHSFVLCPPAGRLQVACMIIHEKKATKEGATFYTPKAFCLFSLFPCLGFCRELLAELVRAAHCDSEQARASRRSGVDASGTSLAKRLVAQIFHEAPLPQSIQVMFSVGRLEVGLLDPLSGITADFSFRPLMAFLSVPQLTQLFLMVLLERKVCLTSRKLSPALVAAIIEVLRALLFPFDWEHTYIPVLPMRMRWALENPAPFLMGVPGVLTAAEVPEDVVAFDLDTGLTIPERPEVIAVPSIFERSFSRLNTYRWEQQEQNQDYWKRYHLVRLWPAQELTTVLPLVNGWQAYGGDYRTPTYVLLGGICLVEGVIKSGAWGHLATLPSECRPNRHLVFSIGNHDKPARVDVLPNGEIHWIAGGSDYGWISLSGIVFCQSSQGRTTLPLENDWHGYGMGFGAPSFTLANGLCFVEGMIKSRSGSLGHVATLPPECRPNKLLAFNANSNLQTVCIHVLSNGEVYVIAGGSDWISLDGIVYAPGSQGQKQLNLSSACEGYGEDYGIPTFTSTSGICCVEGLVKPRSLGHLATLPPGCKPSKHLVFNLGNNEKTARVDVMANGEIHWIAGGEEHACISLTGIKVAVQAAAQAEAPTTEPVSPAASPSAPRRSKHRRTSSITSIASLDSAEGSGEDSDGAGSDHSLKNLGGKGPNWTEEQERGFRQKVSAIFLETFVLLLHKQPELQPAGADNTKTAAESERSKKVDKDKLAEQAFREEFTRYSAWECFLKLPQHSPRRQLFQQAIRLYGFWSQEGGANKRTFGEHLREWVARLYEPSQIACMDYAAKPRQPTVSQLLWQRLQQRTRRKLPSCWQALHPLQLRDLATEAAAAAEAAEKIQEEPEEQLHVGGVSLPKCAKGKLAAAAPNFRFAAARAQEPEAPSSLPRDAVKLFAVAMRPALDAARRFLDGDGRGVAPESCLDVSGMEGEDPKPRLSFFLAHLARSANGEEQVSSSRTDASVPRPARARTRSPVNDRQRKRTGSDSSKDGSPTRRSKEGDRRPSKEGAGGTTPHLELGARCLVQGFREVRSTCRCGCRVSLWDGLRASISGLCCNELGHSCVQCAACGHLHELGFMLRRKLQRSIRVRSTSVWSIDSSSSTLSTVDPASVMQLLTVEECLRRVASKHLEEVPLEQILEDDPEVFWCLQVFFRLQAQVFWRLGQASPVLVGVASFQVLCKAYATSLTTGVSDIVPMPVLAAGEQAGQAGGTPAEGSVKEAEEKPPETPIKGRKGSKDALMMPVLLEETASPARPLYSEKPGESTTVGAEVSEEVELRDLPLESTPRKEAPAAVLTVSEDGASLTCTQSASIPLEQEAVPVDFDDSKDLEVELAVVTLPEAEHRSKGPESAGGSGRASAALHLHSEAVASLPATQQELTLGPKFALVHLNMEAPTSVFSVPLVRRRLGLQAQKPRNQASSPLPSEGVKEKSLGDSASAATVATASDPCEMATASSSARGSSRALQVAEKQLTSHDVFSLEVPRVVVPVKLARQRPGCVLSAREGYGRAFERRQEPQQRLQEALRRAGSFKQSQRARELAVRSAAPTWPVVCGGGPEAGHACSTAPPCRSPADEELPEIEDEESLLSDLAGLTRRLEELQAVVKRRSTPEPGQCGDQGPPCAEGARLQPANPGRQEVPWKAWSPALAARARFATPRGT
eukprot:TRINITY_DN6969_c0_g1_i4.p1 TRINITY_DN6969_c0_g1~~TRINITY_DN6969_c0_g1_i4.p1  ORF type:complete len:1741 (-),score=336.34 TRINITY_DN6969_c0_g1_i4:106-5328(-)